VTSDTGDPISEARRQWVVHDWVDAAPGMAAITTLVRVNQVLTAYIDVILRPYELTFARFEVLRLLGFTRSAGLPMGKLTERLQVHPASVTNAVDRLEDDGLVVRSPNPRDGRSTIVSILPAGRRRLLPATKDLNEFFSAIGKPDDLDRLTKILNSLGQSCESIAGSR
jgi:DNA-binding MarR family transcriptional regulator